MSRAARDLDELEQYVRDLPRHGALLADLFAGVGEIVAARAPARLDVMGGIADYSGSLVLEQPLAEAACVAVAHAEDEEIRIASAGELPRELRFAAAEFWRACASLDGLRAFFAQRAESERWGAYVLGGLPLVTSEARRRGGLRLLLRSNVPEGKGVSSSAALEVAALRAWAELYGVGLSGRELGLWGQRIENHVVGAACGVMDQLTSACGRAGQLLALECQPARVLGFVQPAPGVSLFGIDSGVRHAVRGASYTNVRVAAFMGLRILAERLGARVHALAPGRVALEDDPLGGYLARLAPQRLTPELLQALPERVSGAEFLARFGGISDDVTRVEAAATYAVRAATVHPIHEHARVREFYGLLPRATERPELTRLGQLMLESHASYSACGLGSDGTDELVQGLAGAGAADGVFGAKITGGGSGGTVAVLARTEAAPSLAALSRVYAARTGRASRLFHESSSGAAELPARRFSH
jgi:L-arabinokinase